MALPRSLVQPFRKNKLVIGAGWRALFAPYNIALGSAVASTTQGPQILDLTAGPFDSNNPTGFGFQDLGWIKDFKEAGFKPEVMPGILKDNAVRLLGLDKAGA